MHKIHVRVQDDGEVRELQLKTAGTTTFEAWWQRATPRDRGVFAKFAADVHQSSADAAWVVLEGEQWSASYNKYASDDENPLLDAVRALSVDPDDPNVIETDYEDSYVEKMPPIASVDNAILEDQDEDIA